MTQRERFLSMAIGGLLLAVVFQWAFSNYRSSVRFRQNRLNSLTSEADDLQTRWLAGAEAERQLGEYKARSLSSNPETAQSGYQSWLLETVGQAGLTDASVDPIGDIPVGDLYRRFGFRLSGKADMESLVTVLHNLAAKDTLHRIRELNFGPARDGGLSVVMTLDAIALSIAEEKPVESQMPSWRIASDLETSKQTILNRNFFNPPNQPPRYDGSKRLTALLGQSNQLAVKFTDPEKTSIRYELKSDLPEWARWNSSGNLSVTPPKQDEPLTPLELEVVARDSGYPNRETAVQLTVDFRDPPPPAPPSKPPPQFDDATQTFLTALVQGRDDWTAWMNVRTRGKTLKLKIGDEFEIGSVRGKVTAVDAKRVTLEIDGETYELKPAGKLSEVLGPES